MADQLALATDSTRAHLRGLEADLDEYPDLRGEILLEIAAARLELGEPDRAVDIWRDLIAEGGEDCDYAHVELAEYLFGIGEDENARTELAALKATRRTAGGGWQLAAELLEERGERAEALIWHTMATERFTTKELAALGDDAGRLSVPGMLVRRRREVRAAMGLAPDETDQLLPQEEGILELLRRPFSSTEEATDTVRTRRGMPTDVRMLFWPRSEFNAARERWSDVIDQGGSESQYYRDLETNLDSMASQGAHQVAAVPCSVESFAAFVDAAGNRPLDSSAARRDYLDDRYSEGQYVQWPPPRNQPCWCGSATKYKKCCGAPH